MPLLVNYSGPNYVGVSRDYEDMLVNKLFVLNGENACVSNKRNVDTYYYSQHVKYGK